MKIAEENFVVFLRAEDDPITVKRFRRDPDRSEISVFSTKMRRGRLQSPLNGNQIEEKDSLLLPKAKMLQRNSY